MANSQKHYTLLLSFILLTALILRFWRFWEIPFMFDELSAMSRTVYGDLNDLISLGVVKNDTHPAGVQVFMYFWVKCFGEREIVVKLPFMLAGLASVLVSYFTGKLWFGRTTGLLTAASMASLQFFVMYSQIARPYASGLFLTMMMVWTWSSYFFNGNRTKHLFLYILFSALAAYDHYFSLLFVAICGLSGLFFVTRKNVIHYIISGFAIFILYIPHLPIFFSQLEKGGIGGWLAAPKPDFLLQFFFYLFHFSAWAYGLFLFIVLSLIFSGKKQELKDAWRKRLVLIVWFLLPVIIGFYYSVTVEPILQYSLLIFTAPYLFILFFSFGKELNIKLLSALVALLMAVNILTLTIGRKHYDIFYHQPFDEMVSKAVELETAHPGDVFMLSNCIPYYNEYYFRKLKKNIPYFTIRNKELGPRDFETVVAEISQQFVITSAFNERTLPIVKKYFPYFSGSGKGFTYEYYIFSKTPPPDLYEPDIKTLTEIDFTEKTGNWDYNTDFIIIDSASGNKVFEAMPENEWLVSCQLPLKDFSNDVNTFIDIEAEIETEEPEADLILVASLMEEGNSVGYSAVNLRDFIQADSARKKISISLDVQTVTGDHAENFRNLYLKTFVWNKFSIHFYILSYKISVREGNSFRYALYYDFQE